MTGRRRLGLVAATATLLASAPLSSIFETYSWLMRCILTVGLIAGAALIARTLRFPTWAQVASMVGVLLLVLTWMFPSGKELLSLLPSTHTFQHFGDLFVQAANDTRNYGVPVPDRDGLIFITVLGIGGVAIVVDLVTVVLRRPALAGLPMLAIYSVPVAIYVDDVPVLPFIIGSLGFLWLLVSDNVDRVRRFGRRFTGDGRDVDVWEPSPLAAAGRRLAVVGVAAAVILPLAVPGITTGLLSRLTQSGQGVAGLGGGGGGGRINLYASLSGQLTQTDTKELLKVSTNDPNPFYLRIGVADQVSDQGVGSRSNSGRSIRTDPFPDPRADASTNKANYAEYRATVEITGLDQGLAPIYSSTVGLGGMSGSWNYDQYAQALFSTRNTTKGRKYTVDYLRAGYSAAELRTADQLDQTNPIMVQNTSVPKDDFVNKKVAELTSGKSDQYDKVRAIYDYFSRANGFAYSVQTESGTSGTDIDAFLKNKVGYCQQYSAAMTWMVRAAGIPARVAFGFTRGSSTDNGQTFTITNRNAHAWTEVYFDGYGWVPFDPTPASALTGPSRPTWAPDPDATTAAPSVTGGSVTGGNPAATASGRQGPVRDPNDPSLNGTAAAPVNENSTIWLIVGLAALLIALLLTPAVRRAILRRHRHRATAPRAPTVLEPEPVPWGTRDFVVTTEAVHARADAHAAWDELIDTMIDFRVLVDPAETPRHTASRLATQTDLAERAATSVVLLGSAEEKARYARRPMPGGPELTSALDEVRRGLAQSANWRTRLAAVLFPPSVLLRWRLAVADTSARWVATMGRMRDWMSRFSPRRLLPRPTNRS